jgi:hypothetical protein
MQASGSPRKPLGRDSYRKLLDSRKRRVRGLWQRNGKFNANLTVGDDLGKKPSRCVSLKGTTLCANGWGTTFTARACWTTGEAPVR